MSKKILIVDGHSQVFRAFYAHDETRFQVNGQPTNAIFGFFRILCSEIRKFQPTHVAVAFDVDKDNFRKKEYPEYKAGRKETPESLPLQLEIIQKILHAMDIPCLGAAGFEGDDVVATLTEQAIQSDMLVRILSGDRDVFQLIEEKVAILYPTPKGVKIMDAAAVQEKYGITPAQYSDFAALCGESADNLPGIPGVGQKTAAKWLNQYGNLDSILEHARDIKGKVGAALRENLESVRRNRHLNELVRSVPLDVAVNDLIPRQVDETTLEELCQEFALTQTKAEIRRVLEENFHLHYQPHMPSGDFVALPVFQGEFTQWVKTVSASETVALFASGDYNAPGAVGERNSVDGEIEWIALAGSADTFVANIHDLDAFESEKVANFLLTHENLIVYEGKNLAHGLADLGWVLPSRVTDIRLAAYLLDPEWQPGKRTQTPGENRSEAAAALSVKYLQRVLPEAEKAPEAQTLFSLDDLETLQIGQPKAVPLGLAESAQVLRDLTPVLGKQLSERQLEPILKEVESPTQAILFQMERTGIAADIENLQGQSHEFARLVAEAKEDAYATIGREINLSSPKQLQELLFGELNMPKTRKTKTGYSTNAEALLSLYEQTAHPFLDALLRHRDNIKMQQMVDGLINEVAPDGRIHTIFHQTVTATGRLSSSNPNLQNIPARTPAGLGIRDALVAGTGFVELMSVDYSQIEMRIMAHLSHDQALIAAFNSDEDLHRSMAAIVFGVPVEQVTSQQRTRVKATSYGLAYGLSAFGLSRQLHCSVKEAEELRAAYFERFAGVSEYLHSVVEKARETGYTQTILGRRRYFPGLNAKERAIREMSERQALNAPIQGSAADIIKLAMIEVDRRLRADNYQSRILLQVHDELVLEIASGESEAVEQLVREAMGSPVEMSVPLMVAVGRGRSWKDAAHN